LDIRRNGHFQHANRGAVNATPLLTTTLEDGDRLYVLTHGAFIGIDGTDVILRKRRVEIYRRSLDQISLIYLQGFGQCWVRPRRGVSSIVRVRAVFGLVVACR
jgi:hypothetical protein